MEKTALCNKLNQTPPSIGPAEGKNVAAEETNAPSRSVTTGDEPAMLTYVDLSRVTGIRVATLYGMVCRNDIPHFRLAPRIIRFSANEIAAWMAGHHQPVRGTGGR